ncbi:MAG: hypothetical protein EOP48_32215, partial [Sphingobacteriales bacterium]
MLNLISLYSKSNLNSQDEFYTKLGWFIGTIALLALNTLLALTREFLAYKINHTQSYYDVKTNIYHQLILLNKIILLVLVCLDQMGNTSAIQASSVLQLVAAFFILASLYVRLPFYNFKMLKLTIITSSIYFSLALVAIVFVFVKNTRVEGAIHILILVLPPIVIKLVLSGFRNLFTNILRRNFLFIEHSIHYALLLEQLCIDSKASVTEDKILFPNKDCFVGAIAGQNINLNQLITGQTVKLYRHITDKLEQVISRPQNCKTLSLYLAQLYLIKLDNKSRAIEIAGKLGDQYTLSPMKISTEYVYKLIDSKNKSENFNEDCGLELSNYLTY